MTVERGWFIRTKEPNTLFWSLRPESDNGWTRDLSKALLFARKQDAADYFDHQFHPSAQDGFEVAGVN